VELTIAIHHVVDSPVDRILFDTGHQSYVHKILTGGRMDSPGSDEVAAEVAATWCPGAVSTGDEYAQIFLLRRASHRGPGEALLDE
jgi:hypothetical protein